MLVADAQKEIRLGYMGGFMGQLVSGVLWLASAATATWGTPRVAVLVLILGGFFIFPLTQLGLRAMGHRFRTSAGNPLNALGMQVAFVLPLSLPVVGAAALYRTHWFYPAMMVVLGAHYLPFVFLYGLRLFAALCAVLVFGGVSLALWGGPAFATGGWFTGAVLVTFALIGRATVQPELATAESSRRASAGA